MGLSYRQCSESVSTILKKMVGFNWVTIYGVCFKTFAFLLSSWTRGAVSIGCCQITYFSGKSTLQQRYWTNCFLMSLNEDYIVSCLKGILSTCQNMIQTRLLVCSNCFSESSLNLLFRQNCLRDLRQLLVSWNFNFFLFLTHNRCTVQCMWDYELFVAFILLLFWVLSLLEMDSKEMQQAVLKLLLDELPACNSLLLGWLLTHMAHVAEKVSMDHKKLCMMSHNYTWALRVKTQTVSVD